MAAALSFNPLKSAFTGFCSRPEPRLILKSPHDIRIRMEKCLTSAGFDVSSKDLIGKGATANVYAIDSKNGAKAALKMFTDNYLQTIIDNPESRDLRFLKCNGKRGESLALLLQNKDDNFSSSLLKTDYLILFNPVTQQVSLKDEFFVDPDEFVVGTITEFVPNSEPLSMFISDYIFEEEEIQEIAYQLLWGLIYLHDLGIIHRDIKPSNILFNRFTGQLKIIDYGLSRFNDENERPTTPCGSRIYASTEIVLNSNIAPEKRELYDAKIDLSSLGFMLYEIMTGKLLPECDFQERDQMGIEENDGISRQAYSTWKKSGEAFSSLLPTRFRDESPNFCDFLNQLTAQNPNERLSARNALFHPFMKDYIDTHEGTQFPEQPTGMRV